MKAKIHGYSGLLLALFLSGILCSASVLAQEREVSGTVYDINGEPLPGVSVSLMGTTRGTITDGDGHYFITADAEHILYFSFIGMEAQEILVGDQQVINITLTAEPESLDEVMVVGYGVQSKKNVVGAVSQVSGDKIQSLKMGGSLENNLQGALPGLTVIMTDATPGEEAISGLTMLIRGSASLEDNTPLIIVDGIERSFTNIDPNEIASITILKDASATAVYGVRGANGVIIVTTKRGNKGAIQFEVSNVLSMKQATRLPKYLNSYETLLMRNEAFRNDQLWSRIYSDEVLQQYKDQSNPYLYPDFDWMDFLFQPGFDNTFNLNARGGNDFVQYFVSVSTLTEGDIFTIGNLFPYDYDKYNAHYYHKRYNFRNNLDFNLTRTTRLSFNLGGNLKQWGKPIDFYTHETWFEPVTLMPYYPVEVLEEYPDDVIPYDQDNIRFACNPEMGNVRLDWIGGRGIERKKSNELNADIILTQNLDFLTKGLSVTGLYSYNNYAQYMETFYTGGTWPGALYGYYLNPNTLEWTRYDTDGNLDMETPQPKLQSAGDFLDDALRSLYYKVQLDYSRSFGNHDVSAIGLFSRRESRGVSDFTHYEESWVGRASYSFKNKYMIQGSLAYTGSEKFAPGLRFGLFPSIAAGWLISEEQFFRAVLPVINHLKIRYSYGIVGSDAGIARWLYISEYTSGPSYAFGYPFTYYPTIQEGSIPVSDATWEDAVKNNLGVELEFLQGLVSLNIELFNEQRKNILQERNRVPSWLGAGAISGNIGETKSHGFEVDLGVKKMFSNGLYLYMTANLSGSESRVVFYDEPETKPLNLSVEGKPVEIAQRLDWYTPSMGLEVMEYYQDLDELFMAPEATGVSPIPGDHIYLDYNGDGNIDEQDYIVASHPYAPAFVWNAKFGFDFKGFNGQVDFYGVSDVQYQMRQGGMFYLYPFSQNKDNALTATADYWTPDNRDADYPAVHTNVNYNPNYRFSSFSNVNGKYFRLKNLRIGYAINAQSLKTVGIDKLEFALIGTNLFTITDYPLGGDPEGANSGTDFGAYPQLRRYSLEIKVLF